MRVGYVLRWHPTRSETFVDREIGGLRARGVGVDVVGLGARGDAPDDPLTLRPPRGADRRWLDALPILARAAAREALRARSLGVKDQLRVAWLAATGARLGWDRLVVHFAGEAAEWGVAAARILGVPCQVTAHAVDLFKPRPSLPEVLRAADPLVTVCEHHARWLREHHRVEALVVPCGVPLDVPRADPSRASGVVCVARDVPKKGLDDLVVATRELGAPLRLVSDARRLGGPGVLAGPLPPARVPEVLARAGLFALACRVAPDGDRDGLPVAVLEAMAAGLPVVATAVAGLPEVVDDRTGWLVPPGDRRALTTALRAALGSPDERLARGSAGRERLEREGRTVERQVGALLDAWGAPPP